MLIQALQKAGHEVVLVREPGGTPLGEQIRRLLLDPTSEIVPRSELLLFGAARAQLVETVIEPALSAGHHVVVDRYVDSTVAYQGGGRGLGTAASLRPLLQFATGGRMPDRTYLVTTPISEAAQRRQNRSADRMEQTTEEFRSRVAEAYSHVAADEPKRVLTIDGRGAPAEVHERIWEDANGLLDRAD